MSTKKFSLIVRSTILRGEKPNKGLEATAAPTPNLMNRLTGYLPDGTKIVVAQRHGKGGMDFNKLLGGKVYAVAADGVSPVFEKDKEGKATKIQKTEDGLPLFSSSGFYLLSSKEYPALELGECFTRLRDDGAQVIMVSDAQLAQASLVPLESEFDLELLAPLATQLLGADLNLVAKFDTLINKKRSRGIERVKQEALDTDEVYEGVPFTELQRSVKDGNPALVVCWQFPGQPAQSSLVTLETSVLDDSDRWVLQHTEPEAAWAAFTQAPEYQAIVQALNAGTQVLFSIVPANIMRTSVSFRRKVENVMAAPAGQARYGDAVYIHGAMTDWCRGIVAVMHSQHPNFPSADYDAHHYVAAPRQAEIGMDKKTDGTGWTVPELVLADLPALALRAKR